MSSRIVIYEDSFGVAAERFGGYVVIDEVLNPLVDALYKNPFAFKILETNWFRCRYAITKPLGNIPALCVLFKIDEDGNVFLYDLEQLDD